MRLLVSSLLVVGFVAGAVAVGTSSAATSAAKPAPKPKVAFAPLRPLHIVEDGNLLVCEHNANCRIRGKVGTNSKSLISLVGADGKQRFGFVASGGWQPGEVTFKIPASVRPAGVYVLSIVDAKLKPLSNEVPLTLKWSKAELSAGAIAACKTSPDADGDGHDALDCAGDDCDDANPNRYPGNSEVCDAANLDEDCNPISFGIRDMDLDNHPDAVCCNGERCGTDCDDARAGVSPTSPEVCNQYDDNCDGSIDEGVMLTAFADNDKDLYGDAKTTVQVCAHRVPRGYVTNDLDCDDTDIRKNPRGGCP